MSLATSPSAHDAESVAHRPGQPLRQNGRTWLQNTPSPWLPLWLRRSLQTLSGGAIVAHPRPQRSRHRRGKGLPWLQPPPPSRWRRYVRCTSYHFFHMSKTYFLLCLSWTGMGACAAAVCGEAAVRRFSCWCRTRTGSGRRAVVRPVGRRLLLPSSLLPRRRPLALFFAVWSARPYLR
jgi:hypothetical protein